MTSQVSLAVGFLLMLIGASFFYKSVVAGLQGSGFLPLTIISPFLTHLPRRKNSLEKTKEGILVQTVMAPIFFACGFFSFIAGAEYLGLPAVKTTNTILGGGVSDRPYLAFSKSHGFSFPLIAHASPHLANIFEKKIGLDERDRMVPQNDESLNQVIQK